MCLGFVRIISLIDDEEITKKILKQLNICDVKRKPPPRANPRRRTEAFIIRDQYSAPSADGCLINADYPIETYI
jgi:hypothetical protein